MKNKKLLFISLIVIAICVFTLVACSNSSDSQVVPDDSKISFTITFDTQGGSEIAPIKIGDGSTLTLPAAPTKFGYVFDGWYLDDDFIEVYDDQYLISSNITLYAKWADNGTPFVDVGLEFTLNSDGESWAVIDIGTFSGTDLVIPSTYSDGKPVTAVGDYAFYGCSGLTSITIPDSVTSIGEYAFYNCRGLTSVTIPDSVTSIGEYAFYNCSGLTSVTIPDSVTNIGSSAFEYCSGLTSVTFGESSQLTSIGFRVFSGCSGLTSVTIGNGVTSICRSAFEGCTKLTSITFEDTTTWYRTNDYDNWENKTGGTQIGVTNSSQNVTYFVDTYIDYYWYKL